MWIINLLKQLWSAYTAGKAARAAADLPAGKEAVDSIKRDGDTIRAQMSALAHDAGRLVYVPEGCADNADFDAFVDTAIDAEHP